MAEGRVGILILLPPRKQHAAFQRHGGDKPWLGWSMPMFQDSGKADRSDQQLCR